MEVKWTKEQEEAVLAPVSNILVTAAAGAGKTQVLTGRILNRILQGADVTRMLVVTFTNAAAAEMKTRIAKAISEELSKRPDDQHLKRQMVLLPLASIQTIHSFCLDVIKSNFYRADISPDFKIADDAECKIMKAEAIEEAFDSLYEEGDSDFLAFTDSFSNAKTDVKSEEMVMNLFDFAESMPFPDEWLSEQCEMYDEVSEENFEDLYFTGVIWKSVREEILLCKHRIDDIMEQCGKAEGLEAYCRMFKKDSEKISVLLEKESWDELCEAARDFSFDRKVTVKGGNEETKKSADKVRSDVKDGIIKALSQVAYSKEQNVYLIRQTAPILKGLVKSTLRFSEVFFRIKKEKNLVDFSDLEHICIKLLSQEDVAAEKKSFFDEIYVDEYQDSNMAQDYIFRAISRESEGEPNVFTVGDVKQSIYGFRQTSPKLFLEKKDTYRFGDACNRKIVLSKNFRSSEGVVNYINILFEKIMCRDVGGVEYDDEERLVFAASYPENYGSAEIDIINLESDANDETSIREEAVFIAKRIKELMKNEKIYDTKSMLERNMSFSDIAVLMRSPKKCVQIFEDVFKQYSIPVFVDYDDGYFESSETKNVLSLLNVIDNPENDIPLISVLRSPIGGFNEDELAKIRVNEKDGTFYTALISYEKGKLGEKCSDFTNMIKKFRTYAKYMPCHRLIDTVLNETGYYDVVCAMPEADDRMDNIKLLIEQARNYENSSYRGLYNFISYINNVKERSGNLGASKSVSDAHCVVKIMSIHKSKGLEFPVVFLARCGKKMNKRDLSGDLILQGECGIGISYVDTKRRIFSDTPLKVAAKIKKEQEDLSEEIRILYVALTRAKEKLIMTAAIKNVEKMFDKWDTLAKLTEKDLSLKENTYIDYIMAVSGYCKNNNIKGAVVNIVTPSEENEETLHEKKDVILSCETDENVLKMLSYHYPHDKLWGIPSKVTVTELKRLETSLPDEEAIPLYVNLDIKTPDFIAGESITPQRRGQIMHFIMQNIDFNIECIEDVKEQVESLVLKNIISKQEADVVDCAKIASFFVSPLGVRLKNADKVFREEAFAMAIPASMITGDDADFEQKVMVQGIIDCYFFEGDNIVLLDYKTDRNCSEENIVKNYKKQLDIYAEALEKKFFKKIYEKFIYLFHNGGIIKID